MWCGCSQTLQLCVKSTNSMSPQLANNLQTIVSTLPIPFREKMARRRVNETINEVSEKLLVKLHRNVKRALQAYNRTGSLITFCVFSPSSPSIRDRIIRSYRPGYRMLNRGYPAFVQRRSTSRR